jgi:type VI secretion system protein ImpA
MDCIDLKQLLKESSEASPSGDDLEYDPLFGEMELAAKGKEEQQFGDTLIAAEEPDWSALKSCALAVVERSKDLRAAVQLARALIHTDGYAGLADSLSLLKGYLDNYWDSLHPQLDPDDGNDPTIRINTLLNLCDTATFLLPIARLPLIRSRRLGLVSYRDIQIASSAVPASEREEREVSLEQIEAAFRDADSTQILNVHNQLRRCIESLDGITGSVNARLGPEGLFDLQPLLDLLKRVERELVNRSLSDSAMEQGGMTVKADDKEGGLACDNSAGSAVINGRDDVIRSLDRICHYYARHEPSSPVPLLLRRAKRLVTMGFDEIVQDLAPDGKSHFDFLWRQGDG